MNAPLSLGIVVSLLRASFLTLAFTCPGSIRETPISINGINIAAVTGSAEHKVVESLPRTGFIDWESVDGIAVAYEVDANELRYLSSCAQKLWDKVKGSFPNAFTEVAVEHTLKVCGLKITGHIDGVAISGDVARIYDWKFGRLDNDYYHQMMAYAAMILLEYPEIREVTATILWARDQDFVNYTVTRADAEAWIAKLEAEVINWDGTYRPSHKCEYCPRSHECPAFNALARRNSAALLDIDVDHIAEQIAHMPGQQVIELRRKAKMASHIADAALDAIRNRLLKEGEIVGEDAMLTLDSRPKHELDPAATYPILEELGFEQADYAQVTTLRKSKIEDIVKERAGRGNGAAAIRKLRERLEHAGALHTDNVLSVRERRI